MENNSVVAIYSNHVDAEAAIKELQKSGFDMKQLSIIGKDYHTEEQVVGFYNVKERMGTWGKFGAFWGAIGALLLGSGLFFIPGVGPVLVGGPVLTLLLSGLEGAVVIGGLSALGGALYSLGVPKDSVLKYERAIKSDKFLLLVHGTREQVEKARNVITDKSKAEEAELYMELVAPRK